MHKKTRVHAPVCTPAGSLLVCTHLYPPYSTYFLTRARRAYFGEIVIAESLDFLVCFSFWSGMRELAIAIKRKKHTWIDGTVASVYFRPYGAFVKNPSYRGITPSVSSV